MNSVDSNTLTSLIVLLGKDFPGISWKESERFSWDPDQQIVFFDPQSKHPKWSLLHEAGHMSKQHQNYTSDVSLLMMEVEAWDEARNLAAKYGESIDQDHIEDCLDSYRDWLHKRSQCPKCAQNGVEQTRGNYFCINCRHQWKVSDQRFCRVYRKSKTPQN